MTIIHATMFIDGNPPNEHESEGLKLLRQEVQKVEETLRRSEAFMPQLMRVGRAVDTIRYRMNLSNDPPEKLLTELRSLFAQK